MTFDKYLFHFFPRTNIQPRGIEMNTIEVDCNDIEENVVQDSNPKKSTIVCGEKKK